MFHHDMKTSLLAFPSIPKGKNEHKGARNRKQRLKYVANRKPDTTKELFNNDRI